MKNELMNFAVEIRQKIIKKIRNMTVEELQSKQEQLRAEMYSNAEKLGLSTANLKPIPDGVLDAEKYLTSSQKIMWVLKEPYDDIDEEGNPQDRKSVV